MQDITKNFTSITNGSGFFQIISKIKDRFLKISKPAVDSEVKLKVTKIDGDASDIVMRLINVKTILKNRLDEKTYGYVVELIDPLAQDAQKMSGLVQKAHQEQQLENVLERYRKWMTKAKSLIRLEKNTHRSEHVVQVVVEHLLGNLNDAIDRDISSLMNYRGQIEGNQTIDESLVFCVGALNALKEFQVHPGLDQFDRWKRWVNSRSAALFDVALHLMDQVKGPQ